jgi:tRNA 5-methylaminomethyl-2-thiouridine biosynthesis bifunctional protein
MTGGPKIDSAVLDWVGNAPRSILFGDIYFSGDGHAETHHVFLDGNELASRFQSALQFSIGELGFGVGLNILAAWNLWRLTVKPAGARLDFLSIEKFPLTKDDLARAHAAWPQFAPLSARLIAAYPPRLAGMHQVFLDRDVTLTLAFGDAAAALSICEASIDAWFLDGFAPAKNPEMWSPDVFAEVARLSAPQATAATFTVAGEVRRGLAAAGFAVEKRKGFGRKREMLTARLTRPRGPAHRRKPWFEEDQPVRLASGARVAIIGGGVAGTALAHALRRSGFSPTIIDRAGLAGGASGNAAGLIMPRLDLGDGPTGRFFKSAYLHALRVIDELAAEGEAAFFNACGVALLARDDAGRDRFERAFKEGFLSIGMMEQRADGLFFPQAGVIAPRLFCKALAGAAALVRQRARRIETASEGVRIYLDDGVFDADAVVLANGVDALRFVEGRTLPLSAIMGQIDWFPKARSLECGIAFGPYAAPAPGGGVVIGATYERIEAATEPGTTAAATASNIAAVAEILPDLASELRALDSIPRAALRCQTPDRSPVVGPIPDWHYYGAVYDDVRLGKQRDFPPAKMSPRRFALTGLGSRGLVSASLCAAMIAARLAGAPSPVDREIAEAVHPARFFMRDLKRK